MGIFAFFKDAEDSVDVVDVVVGYVKQETLEPLRGIGRWIVVGTIASSMISIGLVMTLLGALRLSRDLTDSAFDGMWSFAPYLIVFVLGLVCIGATLTRVKKRSL